MILLQYEKVGKTFQDQEIKKETKQQFYTTGILKQENMERLFSLSSSTRIKGH